MHVRNSIAIQGHQGVQHAVSVSSVVSAVLNKGVYDILCDVDIFIRVARKTVLTPDTAAEVTLLNGYKILAGNAVAIEVPQDCIIGMIAAGAGTAIIHRVSE